MNQHRRKRLRIAERARQRRALANAHDCVVDVLAHGVVAERFGGGLQRPQNRHAGCGENAERAGKAHGVVAAHEFAEQRGSEQPAVESEARAGLLQNRAHQIHQHDHADQHRPPPVPHEPGQRHHHDGEEGQLLLGAGEHVHHLRHHVAQQKRDDAEGDERDDRRIREREHDLLLQRIALLDIVGEPRQHQTELAGMFAGRDQRAVDLGKVFRMLRQRIGERMAAEHFRADRRHQFANVVALRLLGQHRERFVERQARDQQAGELARQDRLLALRQTPPQRQPLTALATRACGGRFDDERRQSLRAQIRPRAARAVRVEYAFLRLARRVDRFETKCRHALMLRP